MSFIFGGGAPDPLPPPEPPKVDDPSIEEERRKTLIAASLRKGRSSTILTSGLGVPSEGRTSGKTLLSGAA